MKCYIINSIIKRKLNIYLLGLALLITVSLCSDGIKPPKANPFKEDKTVTHSLFRERNSKERLSSYAQAIPEIKKE
jgi:hypothetical protein